MGLALPALRALSPYLRNASILSLGYPDILATPEQCEELFGFSTSSAINGGAQHGVHRPLVETKELLTRLGSRFECVDVVNWRGFEQIADLNYEQSLGQFDLVIDAGTTEHCFNVGQAMLNAANAVTPGGRIYHSQPMTMINHGFYNICPTMLQDFYTQNNWEIELLEARIGASSVPISETGAMARKVKISNEAGIICIARRRTAATLQFPVQRRYQLMRAKREAA